MGAAAFAWGRTRAEMFFVSGVEGFRVLSFFTVSPVANGCRCVFVGSLFGDARREGEVRGSPVRRQLAVCVDCEAGVEGATKHLDCNGGASEVVFLFRVAHPAYGTVDDRRFGADEVFDVYFVVVEGGFLEGVFVGRFLVGGAILAPWVLCTSVVVFLRWVGVAGLDSAALTERV